MCCVCLCMYNVKRGLLLILECMDVSMPQNVSHVCMHVCMHTSEYVHIFVCIFVCVYGVKESCMIHFSVYGCGVNIKYD
jgi:hypothetical protein